MDRMRTVTIESRHEGKRLDNVLRELMPRVTLGRIAKLVRKKRILVNGGKARHQQRVAAGDVVTFLEAPMEESWTRKGRDRVMSRKVLAVDALEFEVLHEDEHLLAVSKPPGLLVHGTLKEPNAPTLIDQVLAYVAQRQVEDSDDESADARELGEFVRPSPTFQPSLAHRIDRDTSGVVLVAKTLACLQELTRLIKKRQIDKRYIGLVKGGLPGGSGSINAPVARRDAGRKERGPGGGRQGVSVGRGLDGAKPALTRYRTLAQHGSFSLAEFELVTGRTHQIRAHLRHVGTGLAGDDEYGDRVLNRYAREHYGLKRQFLHAASVTLVHPMTGKPLHIVAPLPDDLRSCLERIGFDVQALPESLVQDFETVSRTVGTGAKPGTDAGQAHAFGDADNDDDDSDSDADADSDADHDEQIDDDSGTEAIGDADDDGDDDADDLDADGEEKDD